MPFSDSADKIPLKFTEAKWATRKIYAAFSHNKLPCVVFFLTEF